MKKKKKIEVNGEGNLNLGEIDSPFFQNEDYEITIKTYELKPDEEILVVDDIHGELHIVPPEEWCEWCSDNEIEHEFIFKGTILRVCRDCRKIFGV